MNKRCARQLTEEQRFFLEALLTMDWLPRDVFNAVFQAVGESPREYQRQTTRAKAAWLWFDLEHEKARLRAAGKQPYAEGGNAAVKTIAHKCGMSVANVERILRRYKPTAKMREIAEQMIPFLIDGTILGSTKKVDKYRVGLRLERGWERELRKSPKLKQ